MGDGESVEDLGIKKCDRVTSRIRFFCQKCCTGGCSSNCKHFQEPFRKQAEEPVIACFRQLRKLGFGAFGVMDGVSCAEIIFE